VGEGKWRPRGEIARCFLLGLERVQGEHIGASPSEGRKKSVRPCDHLVLYRKHLVGVRKVYGKLHWVANQVGRVQLASTTTTFNQNWGSSLFNSRKRDCV